MFINTRTRSNVNSIQLVTPDTRNITLKSKKYGDTKARDARYKEVARRLTASPETRYVGVKVDYVSQQKMGVARDSNICYCYYVYHSGCVWPCNIITGLNTDILISICEILVEISLLIDNIIVTYQSYL